jgi:hypothetical protein
MRKDKTKRLALTAVFTAFSTVFLYLSSVFPTGQLGFMGIASLFGIAAVIEYGIPGGLFVFVGTAILSLLIVPNKMLVALYAVFFGYYPILKALAEKTKSRVAEWALKIIVFNIALSIVIFVFKMSVFDLSTINDSYMILYAVGNVVFILFDIGVSRVIAAYISNIQPKLHSK